MLYYATSDWTVKNEYSYGFANTIEVICFSSKKERDDYVINSKYLLADAVPAKEAWRMAKKFKQHQIDYEKTSILNISTGKFIEKII